jgi:UDP-N-acetylmuramoyl-L-alanyl-D-glutamate--2,6-diaminopimelate ligase
LRLTELVKTYKGSVNPDIRGVTQDSREVREGWLFAALPGTKMDGGKFIADAVRNGAAAVLAPAGLDAPENIAFVATDNPRRDLSLAAAAFYRAQPKTIAAVTGTNGKTSTADFALQLWQALGLKAASLGTLGLRGGGPVRSGSMTTPDPVSLHATLADLAAAGIDHLAMEASSHGLDQYRLDGVKIAAAGFTNLTRDHLDYHSSMEDYFAAKARLFGEVLQPDGAAVLNADVPECEKLRRACEKRGVRVMTYGHKGTELKIEKRKPVPGGQELTLKILGKAYDLTLPLVGAFQAMNALCALGLVLAENPALEEKAVAHLPELKGVPGRLQLVPGHPDGAVYVDYAHTPDALENILPALRPHTAGRLICLVGCGGDRDPGKRPVMGRIAADLADLAIVTDDNPRSEDPAAIRAAVMKGAREGKHEAIEIAGRRDAIRRAVAEIRDGDIAVLAGKGHEQGQIIGGKTEPFDDVAEAAEAIALVKKGKKQ